MKRAILFFTTILMSGNVINPLLINGFMTLPIFSRTHIDVKPWTYKIEKKSKKSYKIVL
ncbi:uncharacterized protein Dvar_47130 [Desulfosarcina variabilis str. Montpellier]